MVSSAMVEQDMRDRQELAMAPESTHIRKQYIRQVWYVVHTCTPDISFFQSGNSVPCIPFLYTYELQASWTFPGHPMHTSIKIPRKSTSPCIIIE